MFLKRFLVTFLVIAIFLVASLQEQNICHAALILEGQLFEHGEKLSAEQAVKMTLRIYDDEFGGNLLFEENQEVIIGSEKSLLTFEKGEITVRKRTSGLTTETMWVEVESNEQIMTPRLNLAEIGTVNNLAGKSLSLVEASLRTVGESTLIISDNGVTLGGLLDMGSESIRLGTVTRNTWPDGGSFTETDPTVLSSVKDGVSWSELIGIPTGFSDGVDNDSGGDITGVTAGAGLTGGGTSGNVTLNADIPFTLSGSTAGGVIRATNSYGYLGSAAAYAVHGKATGFGGTGIYGEATGASAGLGVYGYASSTLSTGVFAKSLSYNGLKATTEASGYHAGFFTTDVGVGLAGAALYAQTNNSTGNGVALWAHNDYDFSTDATVVISNDGAGALLKGFGGNGGEDEFRLDNDGTLHFYNSSHTETVQINPEEDAYGSAIYLYNSAGDLTIELDAGYGGSDGRVITDELQVTGGSDLSEQFDVYSSCRIEPGMIVSIDPENPGKLRVTEEAYDKKVAGIVSGAGGIKTGMMMGQKGSEADGALPVALAGRVYCYVDTINGIIAPGDLLTSSARPGYA
ncbi:hypothetical protein KAI46_13175, partial [bacterium]|nr:hypothetical protein [bacterium]